eukprot:873850_1
MSNSNKRNRNSSNVNIHDMGPPPKQRRIAKPRLHFANTTSRSAKYSYLSTFEIPRPHLVFPDEIIEIILNYFHIYDIYKVRQDPYFKAITDIKIKNDPTYMHTIFISSTEIHDLCLLIKYDSNWFKHSLIPKLNLSSHIKTKLNQYIHNLLSNNINDNHPHIKTLKQSTNINNISQNTLELIIQK